MINYLFFLYPIIKQRLLKNIMNSQAPIKIFFVKLFANNKKQLICVI